MKNGCMKLTAILIGLFCTAFVLGCHHATAAKAQPQAQPIQPAPTATLAANPAYIERGESTTLSWQTTNATDITIQGLGTVPSSGTRALYPAQSSTYELSAKGPGGTADVSARVTVNAPRVRPASTSGDDRFADKVQDIFFDYDRFNIRSDQMARLQGDAQFLQRHDSVRVLIEGNCDDRGSAEYNLALGAKRAGAVEQALAHLGVSSQRLQSVSYGKERPVCTQENEQCWQQNRRDHFAERP